MRSIKILGLAVTLALTATAFAGAASASATVLCKENVTPCPAASIYPSGTAIEAKLKTGTTLTFVGQTNEKCTGSTLKGQTTGKIGGPLPAEITSMSFSCSSPCKTVEARNLPAPAGVESTEAGNGTVTVGGAGSPSVKFSNCSFGSTCVFSLTGASLGLEGGNPAGLTAKTRLNREEGSKLLCGESAELTGSYEVVTPKPVFASHATSAKTVLCKENATGCAPENIYPKGTLLEGRAENVVLGLGGLLGSSKCAESSLSGVTNSEIESPLKSEVTSLTLKGCEPCTSNKASSGASSIEAGNGGNGTLNAPIALEFSGCSLGAACSFSTNKASLEFQGGTPGKLVAKEVLLALTSGNVSICGSSMKFTAEYKLSNPSAVWVTHGA